MQNQSKKALTRIGIVLAERTTWIVALSLYKAHAFKNFYSIPFVSAAYLDFAGSNSVVTGPGLEFHCNLNCFILAHSHAIPPFPYAYIGYHKCSCFG